MSALDIHLFAYNSDNYGMLVHDPASGQTASIDAGDDKAVIAALEEKGWSLSHLWITHHHWDHTDGLAALKSATGCEVIGPDDPQKRIIGLDKTVSDGDVFQFAALNVHVLHTPGHTTDMMNFHLPEQKVIFSGDTLFTLGCGRVFEGTMEMMWNSLSRFLKLPPETLIYGAHEYTLNNARFALTVDPKNAALIGRAEEVEAMRERGEPTVPTKLADELKTNPFLRPDDPAIRAQLGMEQATDAEVFAEIRRRKDAA